MVAERRYTTKSVGTSDERGAALSSSDTMPPLSRECAHQQEDKEDTARTRARTIGGYPSNNLDINQLWRAHCRCWTMDIVLFERSTKSNRGSHAWCACGIQADALSLVPGPRTRVCTYTGAHARALSAVRLPLKAHGGARGALSIVGAQRISKT